MTVGNLQDIIEKVRTLAGLGNTDQATDQKIVKYLNSFYLFDLPDDLRVLKLTDVYTFNTIKGVDVYPFDFDNWSTVNAPAYIAKTPVPFFQDKSSFYNYAYNVQANETLDTGDGTAGDYSGTTTSSPLKRSVYNNPMAETNTAPTTEFPSGYPPTFSVNNISRIQNILISAETATTTLHVTDHGNGNLIGDCLAAGTIDYDTGAVANLNFTSVIPSGNEIKIQYISSKYARPSSILFYQNQFVLSPIPDQGYTVEIEAFREPSQALMGTDSLTEFDLSGRPEHYGWWELIAFGIAKKFYQDRLDMDGVQMMENFLQEQISQARTSIYGQLGSRQIPTMFRDANNQLNTSG